MIQFLQLLGLPVSIGIVIATILGASAYLEKIASPDVKNSLARFLKYADWQTLPTKLPKIIRELFEVTFGSRHLSLKCLQRSVAFSLGAIVVLLLLGFISHYSYFRTMPSVLARTDYQIVFFGWIIWAFCIDYLNLFKTRIIIRVVDGFRWTAFVFIPLIVLDLALSFSIFVFSYLFLDALNMVYQMCVGVCSLKQEIYYAIGIYKTIIVHKTEWLDKVAYVIKGPIATEIGVFFWAGLLPTLWLFVYLIASSLTGALSRLATIIGGVFLFLNVEQLPIQSIGFVAALVVAFGMLICMCFFMFFN